LDYFKLAKGGFNTPDLGEKEAWAEQIEKELNCLLACRKMVALQVLIK
jgi:hypothetical protein